MSKQANVRQYYQQFEEQQTQSLIDQKVKEHLGQTAAAFAQQQIGGPFHQHLTTLQSGQYKPLPAPGLLQRPPILPTIRPPVLQPPSAPSASGMQTFTDTKNWIYTQKSNCSVWERFKVFEMPELRAEHILCQSRQCVAQSYRHLEIWLILFFFHPLHPPIDHQLLGWSAIISPVVFFANWNCGL